MKEKHNLLYNFLKNPETRNIITEESINKFFKQACKITIDEYNKQRVKETKRGYSRKEILCSRSQYNLRPIERQMIEQFK